MKIKILKKNQKKLCVGMGLLALFVLWTLLVCFVDKRAIGPDGSTVGFATLNGFVHGKIGVRFYLYTITDWLGLVPIGCCFGFGILGLVQWIKRKSILKTDSSILLLGVFYIVVGAVYLFFESVVVNYRPVLIGGNLEASYPSSTTMLVTCVMPTAMLQLKERIKNRIVKKLIFTAIGLFVAFMVIGRLMSGVHWITDIIGGGIFSAGMVTLYSAFMQCEQVGQRG